MIRISRQSSFVYSRSVFGGLQLRIEPKKNPSPEVSFGFCLYQKEQRTFGGRPENINFERSRKKRKQNGDDNGKKRLN